MKLWRMFRRRGMLALFVGATSLAIVAVACSSSEPAAPAAPAPAAPAPAAPVPAAPTEQVMGAGQTLTILITNLGNGRFDTWLSDGEDLKFLRILNAPLVGGEGGSSIIPGTVKAWEMSPDGKSWTFTVQDDFVSFHNGDKLTVDDVQWSVDKMIGNLALELEASTFYEPRNSAEAKKFNSVELGPGSDQFTTSGKDPRPDLPFWLSENAQGPQGLVQPKAYTLSQVRSGDTGYEGYERAPIGAGPMMITDWVLEQKYSFERFTDYWWHPGNGFAEDRRVNFEFLTMEVVPEDATRVAALRSGTASLIEASVLMTEGIESAGGEIVWQDESAYNWILMVDCWESSMWCYDAGVRRAVEMAVDKRTIVKELYGRGATVKGWSYVTPNAMGYSPALDPLPFDVAGAKALLAKAGIVDGKMANGKQVKFQIHTWDAGDTPLLPELSQLMADAWNQNLGFDVEVIVGDASAVRQKWNNRQLPASVLVRTNEARFDGTSITTGGYNNPDIAWRSVKDPELEPWMTNTTIPVRKALNDLGPTRNASFQEVYKILKDDAQQWSAFYTNLPWGVGSDIKPGSYKPWTLVPYVTAIWTAEPAN
ncbi:MAG: ABC transporter substrate-binding protein [Chloroflexi bacterium]|nr:ABC transporter substrate-binding protein [Chloroflexota bacterium]